MRPASIALAQARHGDGSVSPREKAVKNDRQRQLRGAGGKQGGGAQLRFNFWIIYRIATTFILQITHKFSKEVENLQK